MKNLFFSLFLCLCLLPFSNFAQNSNAVQQNEREKTALKLLDSAKYIYGWPVEIGIPSALIDTLQQYQDIYAVQDFLGQQKKLSYRLLTLLIIDRGTYKEIDLKFLMGRERNIINTAYAYLLASGNAPTGPRIAFIASRIWKSAKDKESNNEYYLPESVIYYKYSTNLLEYLSSVPVPWYHSISYFKTFLNNPF